DEGTPLETAEHALDGLGLPMTPFALLQLVGPAVGMHVAETLHEAFPDRFGVSANLAKLVASGKPGVYRPDFSLDEEAVALFAGGSAPSTAEQVRERVLKALAEEVRIMLDEGVVAAPQDIDLCMILGAGWPFHLGGITPYLDRAGYSASRFLPPGVASLPA
ncbi:MAG TPA: 3-hydroxyacyl-CoA dehydrogenase family protein, partial [Nonomuraea sp.]|nr:3-hydroxyacyl-CoA dehydrogenase family protein [Nonomuraea sp.]